MKKYNKLNISEIVYKNSIRNGKTLKYMCLYSNVIFDQIDDLII